MGGSELKSVSLSDKEIELIISALDYQNYEFLPMRMIQVTTILN